MRLSLLSNLLFLIVIKVTLTQCATFQNIEGRYSFSLTTFSPTGKLQQVEHAIRASLLGTPTISTVLSSTNSILFITPYTLPSPFINNDGTTKFIQLTSCIVITTSGISADGRKIITTAQKLAIEYEYTYDNEIPLDVLLEEMSLLFQSYTSKPACRPFGCALLIGYVDDNDNAVDGDNPCKLYQIDPSGSVTDLGNLGCIGHESNTITQYLQNQFDNYNHDTNTNTSINDSSSQHMNNVINQKDIEEIAINALLHSENNKDLSLSNDNKYEGCNKRVYLVALFNKKHGLLCSSIVK